MKLNELSESYYGYSVYNRLPPTYESRDDLAEKWLRGEREEVLRYVVDYEAKVRHRMEELSKGEAEKPLSDKAKLRNAKRARVLELRRQGKKLREIALEVGYSIASCCIICKRGGVK